jgi:hypothetical protein
MLKLIWTHGFLRGLGHQSVTPYVHGRWLYCCVYVAIQGWVELVKYWRLLEPFIAQGRAVTMRPQGPTGGPEVVETLYRMAPMDRSSKWCLQWCGVPHVLSSSHVAHGPQMAPSYRVTWHCSGVLWMIKDVNGYNTHEFCLPKPVLNRANQYPYPAPYPSTGRKSSPYPYPCG